MIRILHNSHICITYIDLQEAAHLQETQFDKSELIISANLEKLSIFHKSKDGESVCSSKASAQSPNEMLRHDIPDH